MSTRSWALLAISCIGPTVLLWAAYRSGFEEASFPQRAELACVQARVLRVESMEYGARIQAAGLVGPLFYSRKSGEFDGTVEALASAANQPLTLCYRARDLAGSARALGPDLFEARSKQGTIRSLDEVRESWREDRRLMFVLVPGVLLASLYLAFRAGTFRQRDPAAVAVADRPH